MYKRFMSLPKETTDQYDDATETVLMCGPGTQIDTAFRHGGDVAAQVSNRSAVCQLAMSERCSKNWDSVCEAIYTGDKTKGRASVASYGANTSDLTAGQQLLQASAINKFCRFENFKTVRERVPGTSRAFITRKVPHFGAKIVCDVPADAADDPIIQRCRSDKNGACDVIFK